LLRRLDKHANTRGAIDLGLNTDLNGLRGMRELAENKQIRAMWISFHPQLVADDSSEIISELSRLIGALEFSVVSTTHEFEWARKASVLMPMTAWSEEMGTFTNFSGRVQITNRAVLPFGDARPLHVMMAELLKMSGIDASQEPAKIFEWIATEVALYSGLDYDSIGPLGCIPAQAPQEVTR
jgi:predicted molibdopterin-dependent oxidoreductase YjgC